MLVVNGQLAGFNLIDFTIYYAQTSLVFQRRGPTEPPNNFQAMASTSLPPYVVEGIASQLENKPHHVRYVLGNFFQTAQDCCIEVEPLLACGVQKGILNKMAEVMSIGQNDGKETGIRWHLWLPLPRPTGSWTSRVQDIEGKIGRLGSRQDMIDRLEETIFILRDGMSEETNNFLSSDSDVKTLTTEALVVLENFYYQVPRCDDRIPGPDLRRWGWRVNWFDDVDAPGKRQKIWKV